MVKFIPISILFVLLSNLNYAQGLVAKRDSLIQYRIEFDSGNYTHIKDYRTLQLDSNFYKIKKLDFMLTSDSTWVDYWKDIPNKRNAIIQQLYVENSEITHFAYANMKVEDTASSVLNATINMNFFVFPKHWRVGLVINPKFNMRMFLTKPSAPIRTPSNKVGITLFTNTSPKFNAQTNTENWNELNTYYKIISASFYHHSNGQDPGSYNPDGSINIKTGNFGVNFIEVAWMVGRKNTTKGTNNFVRIGYQHDYIIDDFRAENQKKELEGDYGQDRINFEVSSSKRTPRIKTDKNEKSLKESDNRYWRFVIVGAFVFETNGVNFKQFSDAVNIEAKYYWKIPYTPNFMLMSSIGWLGHDYYNIYFNESTYIFRVGIAASLNIGSGTGSK